MQDQLVSFSALTLLFGHTTCKIVPDMTYNVFGGTLNLAQSINPERLARRQAASSCNASQLLPSCIYK